MATLIVTHGRGDALNAASTLQAGGYADMHLDLSALPFARPRQVVRYRCLVDLAGQMGLPVYITPPTRADVTRYCSRMGLFDGVSGFVQDHGRNPPETFFPLIRINSEADAQIFQECERVLGHCNADPVFISRVAENFAEMAANIYWHSGAVTQSGWGYIHGQAYPGNNSVILALSDVGVGFFESYRRNNQVHGRTELQILEDSLQHGVSSLNTDPSRPIRGVGLSTVRDFVEARGGSLTIYSGSSRIVVMRDRVNKQALPFHVDGSIIELEAVF